MYSDKMIQEATPSTEKVDSAPITASEGGAPSGGDGGRGDGGGASGARKRRRRWGEAVQKSGEETAPATTTSAGDTQVGEQTAAAEVSSEGVATAKKKKKSRWGKVSRWGNAEPKVAQPSAPSLDIDIEHTRQLGVLLKKLMNVEEIVAGIPPEELSPSPCPEYDSNGARTNTRVARMKVKLEEEKQRLVEVYNAKFKLADQNGKITRKIMVPVEEFPHISFFGLLVGPRGSTHRRIEQVSGTRIEIRGRGSVQEGKVVRDNNNLDEPMHLMITGTSEEQLDKAEAEYRVLLDPSHPQHQETVDGSLKTLAMMNGTYKEPTTQLALSNTQLLTQPVSLGVRCSICGDGSHPTEDCPLKSTALLPGKDLDQEYAKMMSEIGSGGARPPAQDKPTGKLPPHLLPRVLPGPAKQHQQQPLRATAPQPGMVMMAPQPGMVMMAPQPGMVMMAPQPGMVMMAPQPGMVMMAPQPGMLPVWPGQGQFQGFGMPGMYMMPPQQLTRPPWQ